MHIPILANNLHTSAATMVPHHQHSPRLSPCVAAADADADAGSDYDAGIGWCSVMEWDVLCGRNNKHKHSASHPGNQRFRSLVQSYCGMYQNTKVRSEKSKIAKQIISIIQEDGGRFLKQSEGEALAKKHYDHHHHHRRGWVPLNPAQVYEKVSHALRSAKFQPQRRSSSGEFSLDGSEASTAASAEEEEIEEAFNNLYKAQQDIHQQLLGELKHSQSEPEVHEQQQQEQKQQQKQQDYYIHHPLNSFGEEYVSSTLDSYKNKNNQESGLVWIDCDDDTTTTASVAPTLSPRTSDIYERQQQLLHQSRNGSGEEEGFRHRKCAPLEAKNSNYYNRESGLVWMEGGDYDTAYVITRNTSRSSWE